MSNATLEAYLYGSGAASGSVAVMDTYHTIAIDEGAGAVRVRMNSTGLFSAALNTWAANATAALAGNYTLTISGGKVVVSETGGSNFTLSFSGSSALLLGFDASASYTGASFYEAQNHPSGYVELMGYECQPLAPGDRVELTQYRHGRAVALGFGNVDLFRSSLFLTSSAYGPQIPQIVGDGGGYALTGRVRVQGNDVNPYSATNPDGYIDGFVVQTPEIETFGAGERFCRLAVVVAVPR